MPIDAGQMYWIGSNTGATNKSGFSPLPVAGRAANGDFYPTGYLASFQSFSGSNSRGTGFCWLNRSNSKIYRSIGITPCWTLIHHPSLIRFHEESDDFSRCNSVEAIAVAYLIHLGDCFQVVDQPEGT